jgi:ATP-dependent RNA helicase DHX37/DHR1
VFLTGKREIIAMCKRIKKRFKSKQITTEKDDASSSSSSSSGDEEGEEDGGDNKPMKKKKKHTKVRGDISKIVEGSGVDDEGDVRDMDMDEEEFDKAEDDDEIHDDEDGEDDDEDEDSDSEDDGEGHGGPVEVHPLYAMLSNQDQSSVFATPKNPNARMIIVATNVAETSITIPGIT